MKKILSYFSYLPKKPLLIVMGLLLAVTMTATAVAEWGPDRPTKPYSDGVAGFDYVTFNSFTGVPGIGDEREFYNGQYPGQTDYSDPLNQLRAGDEVTMHVYIHNNADSSLNESGEGIAKNVNVKVDLPQTTAQAAQSKATISASNANPTAVWDTVDFAAENGGFFALDYIEGSAQLVGNGATVAVGDELITTGANIGDVEGCFREAVAVTYKVKVNQPSYNISKQVAIPGQDWTEEVTQAPGDETSWVIKFENIGQLPLTGVKIVDDLPPHTTVVPGSVQLFNGNYPEGYTFPDTAIQNDGKQINLDIGNYNPGGIAYIKFKTTVDDNEIFRCATTRLQNVAYATPTGYSPVNDSANVLVVDENCDEAFIRCEALNASILSKETRTIEVAADVAKSDDITITGYEFNWGDGSTDESDSNVAQHSFAKPGTYKVVATVNYEGGEDTSVTCETTIDFDKGTVTPPNTPPTPTGSLPNTGAGEILASLFGTGSLAGATHMWVNSRRALKSKLQA